MNPSSPTAPMAEPRFAFGDNWTRFLKLLTPQRIEEAALSLQQTLECESLSGRTFLDVGSGSGLFSLAARRLGAEVLSFDFDPQSVACTGELKRRFFPDDAGWRIERASVLDEDYLSRLGEYDIVYSWGVLHHTGNMRQALANVAPRVRAGGILYIAIYNDQGPASKRWLRVKQLYNDSPRFVQTTIVWLCAVRIWGPTLLRDFVRLRPFQTWNSYVRKNRGMSPWHDVVDWVGGFPFEVARPEEILDFYRERRFELVRLKTCGGGLGCNEYVFVNRACERLTETPASERRPPADPSASETSSF